MSDKRKFCFPLYREAQVFKVCVITFINFSAYTTKALLPRSRHMSLKTKYRVEPNRRAHALKTVLLSSLTGV